MRGAFRQPSRSSCGLSFPLIFRVHRPCRTQCALEEKIADVAFEANDEDDGRRAKFRLLHEYNDVLEEALRAPPRTLLSVRARSLPARSAFCGASPHSIGTAANSHSRPDPDRSPIPLRRPSLRLVTTTPCAKSSPLTTSTTSATVHSLLTRSSRTLSTRRRALNRGSMRFGRWGDPWRSLASHECDWPRRPLAAQS